MVRRPLVTGRLLSISIALPLLLQLAGCRLADPEAPTAPSAATETETFQGSVGYQGAVNHTFAVASTGTVEVRLTSVAPLTTMAMGVAVGTWDSTNCLNANIRNDNARAGVAALSGITAAGNYCVKVFDSGNMASTATVTYSLQVTHP